MELNMYGITRGWIFLQASGGRITRAVPLVASASWLAACAQEEPPGAKVDDETPAPYQVVEAEIGPVSGSSTGGTVRFDQSDEFLEIEGRITGLVAGVYGLRVHEARDCTAVDSSSAGPLFSTDPGSPELALDADLPNESGNLGDIVAGENGTASFDFLVTGLALSDDERSVAGRTLVVHKAVEGAGPEGLPVLAGEPVGCGEIRLTLAPRYVP